MTAVNNKPNGDSKQFMIGSALAAIMFAGWYWALFRVTTEQHQGEIYRIIYLHVPSVFTAFLAAAILLGLSIAGLWKQSEASTRWGRACAEVGLLYTILGLATGSIWGRPTWGTWWTWDARLTTTFILALLYAGYILLWNSVPAGALRTKICSVLGLMIAANVPIIYKSVSWWRTLHQPPSLMRSGKSTMSPEILSLLIASIVVMLVFGVWLMWQRYINIKLSEDLEQASYDQLLGQE